MRWLLELFKIVLIVPAAWLMSFVGEELTEEEDELEKRRRRREKR